MALRSDNNPPPPPPDPDGGGKGGGGGGERGYYFEKEYAAIFDGWLGGFLIGGDGELGMGVTLHPWWGLDLGYMGYLYGYNPYTGSRVNGFNLDFLTDNLLSFLPATHNARHLGASNMRFKSGWFVDIYSSGGFTTADIIFKNDWVITEEEDKLIFINPEGKKVLELIPKGKFNETKDDKKYDNAEKFKKRAEQLKVNKLTQEEINGKCKRHRCKLMREFTKNIAQSQKTKNPKKHSANKNSSDSNS